LQQEHERTDYETDECGNRPTHADMREGSGWVSKPVRGPNAKGHIVERYLDVARAAGCRVEKVEFPVAISRRDRAIAKERLLAAGVPEGRPYAVLAVGANWPNKRWPTRICRKFPSFH